MRPSKLLAGRSDHAVILWKDNGDPWKPKRVYKESNRRKAYG